MNKINKKNTYQIKDNEGKVYGNTRTKWAAFEEKRRLQKIWMVEFHITKLKCKKTLSH